MGRPSSEKSGLAAAVDDLEEEFPHRDVDRVADEVGVEGFEDGLTGEDLRRHRRRVGHTGTSDGLHEGFLDDAVFDVQGQLAGALLGGAPADAVGQAGDVFNFVGFYPFAFFGDRGGAVLGALRDDAHK